MVTKENSRFHIGDWIVHYFHGVGKVKDIVKKGLGENRQTFFKVSTKDIDYWIPVDGQDSDHIEPIRSKNKFEEALKLIASAPQPIGKHHKSRKKRIHDRWCDGSLTSRAELMRDLYGRLKLEKLSFSEKETLGKVRRYFINEWIITDKNLTRPVARKRLNQALKASVKIGRNVRKESEDYKV